MAEEFIHSPSAVQTTWSASKMNQNTKTRIPILLFGVIIGASGYLANSRRVGLREFLPPEPPRMQRSIGGGEIYRK